MSSVGELLDQANVHARALLESTDHLTDGRAMLRTWGEVVAAAEGLWRAIPVPSRDSTVPPLDLMDQLSEHSRGLQRDVRAAGSRSTGDHRLQEIADLLTKAGDLVAGSGVTRLRTPAQVADSLAARASVMHTLEISVHAVGLGLRNNVLAEKLDTVQAHRPATPATQLLARTQLVEELARGYYGPLYPEIRSETHRDPIDPDRLGASISAFDVQAHRVLAGQPTARDLATVAGTMSVLTQHAHALWRLSAEVADRGMVPTGEFHTATAPALEQMSSRWHQTVAIWNPLVHPHQDRSRAQEAAFEVRAAFAELARDRVGAPTPHVLAARADMREVVQALGRFHATAVSVADAFSASLHRGPIPVNAAPAKALTHALVEAGQIPETHRSPVSPRDIYLKRQIALPEQLRGPTQQLAGRTLNAARRALQATMTVVDHGRVEDRVQQARGPSPAITGGGGQPAALGRLRLAQERSHPGSDPGRSPGLSR